MSHHVCVSAFQRQRIWSQVRGYTGQRVQGGYWPSFYHHQGVQIISPEFVFSALGGSDRFCFGLCFTGFQEADFPRP